MSPSIKIIPPRETDIDAGTRFFRMFLKLTAALALPLVLIFGLLKGLVIDLVLSLALTVIGVMLLDRISQMLPALFGSREALISIRDQTTGTLKAVKVAKMNKEYKSAMEMVNEILEKDPSFYEAMFVKAQILHEGFSNTIGALKYLKTVMAHTPEDESLYSWAASLDKTIKEEKGN